MMMKRTSLLYAVLFPTWMMVCEAQKKKPNLIVVMTDEQNLRMIGAYRDQLTADQVSFDTILSFN